MATPQLPKTFHIFYAWAEGPWHGQALAAALIEAGFIEAPLAQATVLIAHSVGSYLVPISETNRVIVLIGPPYWPGRSVVRRLLRKVWCDFRLHRATPLTWVRKMTWATVYIATKPAMSVKAWRAVHRPSPFSAVPPRAVVVRNQEDVFITPQLASFITNQVVVLPGQHDDCWHTSEPYVKLIQAEYGRANRQEAEASA